MLTAFALNDTVMSVMAPKGSQCQLIPETSFLMLTKTQLAVRWGVTMRTVHRECKRYGLFPDEFRGRKQFYREDSVMAMERRRKTDRLRRVSGASGST
jgi:hypothetical protein